MSQNFPPYPPVPYHPNARQPYDPLAAAKKASILMWVLGVLGVLFGLCTAAILGPMIAQIQTGSVPNANPADLQRARDQIQVVEKQLRDAGVNWTIADFMYGAGIVMVVAGGIMGLLAFFVRRGSKVAAIVSTIYAGLIGAYLLLNVASALILGGGQGAMSACMTMLPLGLVGLLMMWLIQSLRSRPPIQPAGFPATPATGEWTGGAASPGQPPPIPATLPQPPVMSPPGQGLRPDGLFDPAPFGVPPPPPDDTPAGKYGYPTKPKDGGAKS